MEMSLEGIQRVGRRLTKRVQNVLVKMETSFVQRLVAHHQHSTVTILHIKKAYVVQYVLNLRSAMTKKWIKHLNIMQFGNVTVVQYVVV